MKRYNLIVVFLCLSFISFGQCKGDCENGKGIYKYESGAKYNGEWLNDKHNGKGILTTKDYKYDGEWLDGRRNGYGVYEDESIKYDGEWLDGRRNGQGILTHKDYKYDGEWLDGKRNGYGVLEKNKPKKIKSNTNYIHLYEGYFKDDKFHGDGSLTYYNNIIWTGIFKDGKQFEGHYNHENYYNSNDILGFKESCRIELDVADNKSYNIIVSFGEINQEFIFDTGATSGFSCPTSFIKKLKKAGVKIEFLKFESQAELADNSKIDIKYAIVDGVKIGDYTLNNFVVQYADNASFLLGTGALAKFSDWVCNKKGILTLYK